MSTEIYNEVFAKAATKKITNTNLGGHVQVDVVGYTYTVIIRPRFRASIDWRYGWGGTESIHINATPAQDAALRKAMREQGV